MQTQTDHRIAADAPAAVNGIVALLAETGLSDDQITALTGRDPRPVRSLVEDAGQAPAREESVIDRARKTMIARSQQR